MEVKLKADYGAVLHLPILREGKDRASHLSGSMEGHQNYAQPGEDESVTACQSANNLLLTNMWKCRFLLCFAVKKLSLSLNLAFLCYSETFYFKATWFKDILGILFMF